MLTTRIRHCALFVLGLVVLVAQTGHSAQPQSCPAPESVTNIGVYFDPGVTLTRDMTMRTIYSPSPLVPASHFRLRLAIVNPSDKAWRVDVRDSSMRLIESLDATSMENRDEIWTGRIPGPKVLVYLVQDAGGESVTAKIEGAFAMPKSVSPDKAYYSWMGTTATYKDLYEEKDSLNEAEADNRKLGDVVGFVTTVGPSKTGQVANWCCSGILMTDSLFLTNWHCGAASGIEEDTGYWTKDICAGTTIDLSWDGDREGREYSCVSVEDSNKKLDYAVLRIRPNAGTPPLPMGWRRVSIGTATLGQKLRIIHHSECMKKQITTSCTVKSPLVAGWKDAMKTDLQHDCDTEQGGSGAPVFDEQGRLVALHHLGRGVDQQCHPVYAYNGAVRADAIFAWLKANKLDLYRELIGL